MVTEELSEEVIFEMKSKGKEQALCAGWGKYGKWGSSLVQKAPRSKGKLGQYSKVE